MTVNIIGDPKEVLAIAKQNKLHAYASGNVIAVEIPTRNKAQARQTTKRLFGNVRIAYIYE